MSPTHPPEKEELEYWRKRIFFAIFFSVIVLGHFAYIPSLIMAINKGLWVVVAIATLVYLWAIGTLVLHQIPFRIRATSGMVIFYALGLWLLIFLGPFSGGPVWLFAFPIITGILLGLRPALFALFVNTVTVIIIGCLMSADQFAWVSSMPDYVDKWVVISANFLFLNAAATISLVVLVRGLEASLKKQKLVSDTLEREQAQLLSIFDSIDEIVYVTDPNTYEILYINKYFRKLLGNDCIGGVCYREFQGFDNPCEFCTNDIILKEIGKPYQWEYYNPIFDRDYMLVDRIIKWPDDRDVRLEFAIDITDRKQMEEQRRKLQERLEKAEKMESLGVLAGGVAHDLNNMLGPLVGYPELMLMTLPEDSPLRKQVQLMGEAANNAVDVIQDLLTLARRGRIEMVPTNLNQVLETYLDSLSFEERAKARPDIIVKLKLDKTIANINGSFYHLSKAIMNLIVNAYDAMLEGGELTIETSQQYIDMLLGGHDKIEQGDYVLLRIRDTGMGIESKELDRIFEPYYSKKKMGASGSGLGLSVVYGVVKDHKGYYDVFSTIGEGTEFILYFPVTERTVKEELCFEANIEGNESVLIIDDVAEQRELASELLESLGYKAITACNGGEAIQYLKDNNVDIVMLDMIVEDNLDGLDIYREIIKLHPGQKAVIVSGFSSTDRVEKAQELGAGQYVKKPYTRDTLAKAIRKELDKKPTPATS